MAENRILIITKENNNIAINIKNSEIHFLELKDTESIIKKINMDLHDSYEYIVFIDKSINANKINNYIPLNIVDDCKNHIFANELILNELILNSLNNLVEKRYLISVAIVIRYIMKNNFDISNFNLDKEINNIKEINNCEEKDVKRLKHDLYNAVKKHYTQNSIFHLIKFKISKDKIVNIFLYKETQNIMNEIKKNTNINLVFKELIRIIK